MYHIGLVTICTFFICIGSSNASSAYVPTIAIPLTKFPTDPNQMEFYYEQLLIGQVVEPLFTTGDDGLLTSEIVRKWEFNSKKTHLTIFLKDGIQFSNGQFLTAEDVKSTIERQLEFSNSSGGAYLSSIDKVEVVNASSLRLILKAPNVTLMKALSRQSFGIRPKAWKFDENAIEPYIGTGPYRLVKENANWYFKENPFYRNKKDVSIKSWSMKLVDYVNDPIESPNFFPLADLFLILSAPRVERFLSKVPKIKESHDISDRMKFTQSSFWWIGKQYKKFTKNEREALFIQLSQLVDEISRSKNIETGTGLIPQGIPGSLRERKIFQTTLARSRKKVSIVIDLTIADAVNSALKQHPGYGEVPFKLVFFNYHPRQNYKVSNFKGKDLYLLYSMAGFFDPEGFLSSVPAHLGSTSSQVFGERIEKLRRKGQIEIDPIKRSEIYAEVSRLLINEIRLIPGWVYPVTELRSKDLKRKVQSLKYAFRLTDYYLAEP